MIKDTSKESTSSYTNIQYPVYLNFGTLLAYPNPDSCFYSPSPKFGASHLNFISMNSTDQIRKNKENILK